MCACCTSSSTYTQPNSCLVAADALRQPGARYGCGTAGRGMPTSLRPEVFGRVEIEALVQVDTTRAAATRRPRRTGEATHRRTRPSLGSVFANITAPSVFEPFAGVEGDAGGEEGVVAQGADAFDAETVELLDLAQLRVVRGVGGAFRSGATPRRRERDIPHPERDRRLAHAEPGRDLGQREALARAARGPAPVARPCRGSPWWEGTNGV